LKKWILRTIVATVALAALTVLLFLWLAREPHYKGRPLSQWTDELRKGTGQQRLDAAEAIRNMGAKGIPYLSGSLTNPPSPAARAAKAVANHVPDRLKERLRKFYEPPNELATKLAALNALQALGSNSVPAVDAVTQAFRQEHIAVSTAAANTLAGMGTNALPSLISGLDDPDYNIRSLSCHAIATLQTNAAAAVPRLESIARDEIGPIASGAFYALSRIGAAAVPALSDLVASTNASVRSQALYALGSIGPAAASAENKFLEAASDPVPDVRWRAIEGLPRLQTRSSQAEAALLAALSDPDPRIRSSAVDALAYRPRIVSANLNLLVSLLEDESPEVRAK
jgi:HEAT repeat protein